MCVQNSIPYTSHNIRIHDNLYNTKYGTIWFIPILWRRRCGTMIFLQLVDNEFPGIRNEKSTMFATVECIGTVCLYSGGER